MAPLPFERRGPRAGSTVILIGPLSLILAAACGEPFYAAGAGGASSTATTSSTGGASSTGATSGTSSGTPVTCSTAQPGVCGTDAYCEVDSACGSGKCVPVGSNGAEYDPLCACDGLTYWSPALAAAAKANIQKAGACGGQGSTCTVGSETCHSKFGEGAYCSVPVDGAAACPSVTNPPTLEGTCWALPSTCPDKPTGYACLGPGQCKTLCALIEGQLPYWETSCAP